MADAKLTALADIGTALAVTDIFYVVDDPGGTPISVKSALSRLLTLIETTALATIEVGHASDTTITRSASGFIDVEGHTVLFDDRENQACVGGVTVTEKDLGTPTNASTLTLDMGDRPIQKLANNVAGFTLDPGTVVGSCLVVITNGASAGTITTSGWTKVTGSSFTTTNAHKFVCHASVTAAGSLLVVQAMQ